MNIVPKLVSSLKIFKEVKVIYLFGSKARGEAGVLSDTDICIIAPIISEKLKTEILGFSSRKVDIVLFEDLPLNIKMRVLQEGKVLFVSDQRYMDDLAWRTTKEYIDFGSRRNMFLQLYLPEIAHV